MPALHRVAIRYERDVVLARQRARQITGLVGFDTQDQTRIATAVSEVARNAFEYARGGDVEFRLEGVTAPQLLVIEIKDRGPGIPDLPAVLEGRYRSRTGMGVGIVGARRLMDRFEISSPPGGGTTVALTRLLPRKVGVLGPDAIARLTGELARQGPSDPFDEIQRQNQELLGALEELGRRQEELAALNRELEDTNRGVVALYAELDEKADHLRRADELKSRFLSNMTHEFRTPVNSIQALTRILLDRTDGDLSPEQERQVTFIRKAADSLSELVNDLLDLAKVEAGKIEIHPSDFTVEELFGMLRGMLKPLLVSEKVSLIFETPEGIPSLYNDEAKISQILRNFISNALKYTERGEVRVRAIHDPETDTVSFEVADTGIGIAPEEQERIFEEFVQVENPLQHRVKGTGLGLPLSRRTATATEDEADVTTERSGRPVLVVENDPRALTIYDRYLRESRFRMVPARSLRDARRALAVESPHLIVLDVLLEGEDSWKFLADLKSRETTKHIPVIVVSSVDDRRKGLALGADAYGLKPVTRSWLLGEVDRLTGHGRVPEALIIDDDDVARYVLKRLLSHVPCVITEMPNGTDGFQAARELRPDIVFLDLSMPDVSGADVLARP